MSSTIFFFFFGRMLVVRKGRPPSKKLVPSRFSLGDFTISFKVSHRVLPVLQSPEIAWKPYGYCYFTDNKRLVKRQYH